MSTLGLLLAVNTMAQEISIGPNVQVSAKNGSRAHWEVRISADPGNAQHLVACSMVHSGRENSIHSILYVSLDGRRSWTPTLESDRTKYVPDPDCVFGLGGAAYFSVMAVRSELPETLIYRSPDGGWKWEKPVALPYLDREYITVDQTYGKYRG